MWRKWHFNRALKSSLGREAKTEHCKCVVDSLRTGMKAGNVAVRGSSKQLDLVREQNRVKTQKDMGI